MTGRCLLAAANSGRLKTGKVEKQNPPTLMPAGWFVLLCRCYAAPGINLSPAIAFIAFCSFSNARTSIWRMRSRDTL